LQSATSRSLTRFKAAPVSTQAFQGWMLVPEGAWDARERIAAISSRGTGSGRKARQE